MNTDNLQGVIPDNILSQLPNVIETFEINTPLRLAHFISQCAHESANFIHLVENLNYSADALLKIFPSHFTDIDDANQYARQPEKIANRIYANRMGNGDEDSGDGWKYRGRGALQITGKNSYQALSDDLNYDFISDPDSVATDYALASAGWFFKKNNLFVICDEGDDTETITKLTKKINGDTLGLDSRIELFNKFYQLINE